MSSAAALSQIEGRDFLLSVVHWLELTTGWIKGTLSPAFPSKTGKSSFHITWEMEALAQEGDLGVGLLSKSLTKTHTESNSTYA